MAYRVFVKGGKPIVVDTAQDVYSVVGKQKDIVGLPPRHLPTTSMVEPEHTVTANEEPYCWKCGDGQYPANVPLDKYGHHPECRYKGTGVHPESNAKIEVVAEIEAEDPSQVETPEEQSLLALIANPLIQGVGVTVVTEPKELADKMYPTPKESAKELIIFVENAEAEKEDEEKTKSFIKRIFGR